VYIFLVLGRSSYHIISSENKNEISLYKSTLEYWSWHYELLISNGLLIYFILKYIIWIRLLIYFILKYIIWIRNTYFYVWC